MEVFVAMINDTVTVFLSGDDAVQYADECLLEYGVGDLRLIKCEVKLPKSNALNYWCQEKPKSMVVYAVGHTVEYEFTETLAIFEAKEEAEKYLEYVNGKDGETYCNVVVYPLLSKFSQEDFE